MELESLRKDLIANEKAGGGLKYDPVTGDRGGASAAVPDAVAASGGSNARGGKLAPGPFAGISKSGAGAAAPPPAAAAPGAADALQQRSGAQQQEAEQHESEQLQQQRRHGDSGAKEEATLEDHADVIAAAYTTDGYRLAAPRRPGKSPPPPPQLSSSRERVDEEGEVIGATGEDDDEFVPTGGYPKRLASAMSFCRVSTKVTCEVLIALGRVTVNGVTASDPMMKVDVLADIVVCNGE